MAQSKPIATQNRLPHQYFSHTFEKSHEATKFSSARKCVSTFPSYLVFLSISFILFERQQKLNHSFQKLNHNFFFLLLFYFSKSLYLFHFILIFKFVDLYKNYKLKELNSTSLLRCAHFSICNSM